ncbi:hypothetical protein CTI12_AA412260 [Artemisia annua]|uniref:Uncharacterized protein n=1 Tax=Artemisia annua TaxID=35608 RepID=A0A2U1M787_ARTAN|nr:hypothetical protein CTI12_AA412260 [Artemisia annua]
MKKLYKKSSSVHPLISDHHLSLLPAAIFTLTLALSQQDKQVLAYLLSSSSSSNNKKTTSAADHPPVFTCKCFSCYMSYWSLWDSSPNRQLIHDIIDAFEDTLLHKHKTKKDRKKKPSTFVISNSTTTSNEEEETELTRSPPPSLNESESLVAESFFTM